MAHVEKDAPSEFVRNVAKWLRELNQSMGRLGPGAVNGIENAFGKEVRVCAEYFYGKVVDDEVAMELILSQVWRRLEKAALLDESMAAYPLSMIQEFERILHYVSEGPGNSEIWHYVGEGPGKGEPETRGGEQGEKETREGGQDERMKQMLAELQALLKRWRTGAA